MGRLVGRLVGMREKGMWVGKIERRRFGYDRSRSDHGGG
jgi:hypothetical protein